VRIQVGYHSRKRHQRHSIKTSLSVKALNTLEHVKNTSVAKPFIISNADVFGFVRSHEIIISILQIEKHIDIIKFFVEFRNLVSQVESRWCPFNYLYDIAYKREYWGSELAVISKTLHDTDIQCINCVDVLNKTHAVSNPKVTIFQEIID
jgi:hypothetical protein